MKKILILIMALTMIFSLSACKSEDSNSSGETRVVTDSLGREVKIPAEVKTIVTLGNAPRMATYLGLADRVVGTGGMDADKITPLTAYAYVNKDKWKDVPVVGTDAMGNTDYYPEEIIKAKPDVIICTYTEDIVKDLESKTGIPVVAVGMGNLFQEDYAASLRIIGEVCGVEKRATEVVNYINDSLADLDKRTSKIEDKDKPTVLSAAATFKGAHGIEGVRINEPVLDAIHANNVASKGDGGQMGAAEVSREQILAWNPDYIFCDYGGVALVQQDEKKDASFYKQLKAYNNGNMYQHPSSTSYFSNVEIPLANCYFIGSILYPEAFKDVDVEKKSNEIFKFFLGEDDYMSVLKKFGADYGKIKF